MEKRDLIAAIDIGTTKVVAIAGELIGEGVIRIIGVVNKDSYGVNKGVVTNVNDVSGIVKAAILELNTLIKIQITDVFVGIAGQHISSLPVRGNTKITGVDDIITQQDVTKLVGGLYNATFSDGDKIVHVIPQTFSVDNETDVVNPIGMSGKTLGVNCHVVFGKNASVNNIYSCIKNAGLQVRELILEPLASSTAVLTKSEKEVGVALVDIGGGTTDIAIYYDGIIRHTAVIPFGGDVITKDIKDAFKIMHDQARDLKHQFGIALPQKKYSDRVVVVDGVEGRRSKEINQFMLSRVIEARLKEILGSIYSEIKSVRCENKLGAGIVLTGGGALLADIDKMIETETGLEVRIGYPDRYIDNSSIESINIPIYSTSVGLVLRGYQIILKGDNTFNKVVSQSADKPVDSSKREEKAKVKEESKIGRGFVSTIKSGFKKFTDMAFESEDAKLD